MMTQSRSKEESVPPWVEVDVPCEKCAGTGEVLAYGGTMIICPVCFGDGYSGDTDILCATCGEPWTEDHECDDFCEECGGWEDEFGTLRHYGHCTKFIPY